MEELVTYAQTHIVQVLNGLLAAYGLIYAGFVSLRFIYMARRYIDSLLRDVED